LGGSFKDLGFGYDLLTWCFQSLFNDQLFLHLWCDALRAESMSVCRSERITARFSFVALRCWDCLYEVLKNLAKALPTEIKDVSAAAPPRSLLLR
jgi:hypothetical protein